MGFYKCFCFGYIICLILVFCEDNMKQHKTNKKQVNSELKMFKNITDINENIKELIDNFKQLENMYKKYETTDSDSSESDIDKALRRISYNDKSKEKLLKKQIFTTNSPSDNYRGTAYIFENQESSILGEEDANNKKIESVDAKEETTIEEGTLENDAKTETSSEKKTGSDEIETKPELDEVVEIKINADTKLESLDFLPKTLHIKNKPQRYPNNGNKKRFSVLKSSKDNIETIHNKSKILFKIGNKRIVYSEQFEPETIWDEIINRPIKLNRVISSEESSKLNSRENDKNTATVITDDTKEEVTSKMLDDFETQQELSNIKKDENSTLRDGYGDDCIQIPIKKCKKAMKTVSKNVCKRRFKCESEFKSDYEENLKKECVKKFSYSYPESEEVQQDTYNNRVRKNNSHFIDATRLRHPPTVLSVQNGSRNSLQQLRLRDKYEKKCQKESRDKCIAACNDATEKTCSKHTCNKKKSKAMKKACKEECKTIFPVDNNSSKSSDDSSSNSDSGSN